MNTPRRQSSRLRALKDGSIPNTSMGSPLAVLLERESTPQKQSAASISEVMFSPALNVLNNGGVRTPPGHGNIKPPAEEMDPKKSQKRIIADEGLILGFQNVDDSRLRNSPSPVKRRTSPSKLPQRSFKTMLRGMLSPRKPVASPVSFTITSPFLVKSKEPESNNANTTNSPPSKNPVPLRGLSEEAQKLLDSVRADYAKLRAQKVDEELKVPNSSNDAGIETQRTQDLPPEITVRKIAKPVTRKGRFSGVHNAQFDKMDSIANHASAWRAKRAADLTKPKATLKRTLSKAEIADSKAARGQHAIAKAIKRDATQDVATDRAKTADKDSSHDDLQKTTAEVLCKTPPPSPKKTEMPVSPAKSSVRPTNGITTSTPTSPTKRGIPTPQLFAKPSLSSLTKPTASSLARASSMSSLKGSSIPVSKASPLKPPSTPQHASTTLLKPPSISASGTVRSILRRPHLTETTTGVSTSPTPSAKKNVNFSPETHFGPRNPIMLPRKIRKPRPPSAKLIEINKTFGRAETGAQHGAGGSNKLSYPKLNEAAKPETPAPETSKAGTDELRMPGSFDFMDEDNAAREELNDDSTPTPDPIEPHEDPEESDIHKELEKLRRSINGETEPSTYATGAAGDTKKRKRDNGDNGDNGAAITSPSREAVDPLTSGLYPDLSGDTDTHDQPRPQQQLQPDSSGLKGTEHRPAKLQKRAHQPHPPPATSGGTGLGSPNKASSTPRFSRATPLSARPSSKLLKKSTPLSRFSHSSASASGAGGNNSRLLRF